METLADLHGNKRKEDRNKCWLCVVEWCLCRSSLTAFDGHRPNFVK